MREVRLDAARKRRHGLQILSFEQLAVRMAGGFASAIDDDSLRSAIQAVLPATPLGELESIKLLPGMVDAAADTLHKAWRAGIDLAARADDHPRLELYRASRICGSGTTTARHDATGRYRSGSLPAA